VGPAYARLKRQDSPAVREPEQAGYRNGAGKSSLDVPPGTLNAILKQAGLKKAGGGG